METKKPFDATKYQEYEEYFSQEHSSSFQLESGVGGVMISAPHAVEQTRNGRIKCAESQTGALAKMLHEQLHCPIIYKTKNMGDDANYDEVCAYKKALADYVQNNKIVLLLDLHQLSPTRSIQVDVGTGSMKNVFRQEYVDEVLRAFIRNGITDVGVDRIFNAKHPNTVSAYVARHCGIDCLQIELHSDLVRFGYPGSNVEGVYKALEEIVLSVREHIGENYEEGNKV